jgi:inosine/xanthosine triphosphate pyrophosphatase family protein
MEIATSNTHKARNFISVLFSKRIDTESLRAIIPRGMVGWARTRKDNSLQTLDNLKVLIQPVLIETCGVIHPELAAF